MRLKNLGYILLAFIIFIVSCSQTFAQEANFSFYPSNGTVKDPSKGFTVDVLLDSGTQSITKARFAVKFDPRQIQITKASRNNSLFDQWPEDESTIDNKRGMVMLTGFTQSGGTIPLYTTETQPDVLARLEFEVVTEKKEEINLEFAYSGTDEMFNSIIMKDGSPPQNVLLSSPQGATFTLSGYVSPSTAISPSHVGVIVGIVLIGVGIFVTNMKTSSFTKRKGTVVLYE